MTSTLYQLHYIFISSTTTFVQKSR